MRFADSTVLVQGNLEDRQECAFDSTGVEHIMAILANIYGDSRLAVMREYSANALDSHRSAGATRPIEVTLPTRLEPVLTVRDFGLGMSLADVENIYANYGASTKRGENDSIGGFGIGSKAAFTLTSQFTLEAVKGGEKTIAIFSLEDRKPGYSVVFSGGADEPDGVTVMIPANHEDSWTLTAEKCFAGWEPGTVLVNGEQPKSLLTSASRLADGAWMLSDRKYGHPQVLMGGLVYSLDGNIVYKLTSQHGTNREMTAAPSLVFELPIGAVDIRPDREGLRDTARTLKALSARLQTIYADAVDGLRDSIANLSLQEQVYETRAFNAMMKGSGISAKYPSLAKDELIIPDAVRHTLVSSRANSRTSNALRIFPARDFDREGVLYVVNAAGQKTKAQRLLTRYLVNNGEKINAVVVSQGPRESVKDDWWNLDARFHRIMEAADFITEAEALPPVNNSTYSYGRKSRQEVLYRAHVGGNRTIELSVAEIRESGKRVFLNGNIVADAINGLSPDFYSRNVVLNLGSRQTEAALFKKLGVKSLPGSAELCVILRELVQNLPDEVKDRVAMAGVEGHYNARDLLDGPFEGLEHTEAGELLTKLASVTNADRNLWAMRIWGNQSIGLPPKSELVKDHTVLSYLLKNGTQIPDNVTRGIALLLP
jgi:hypothetical protein